MTLYTPDLGYSFTVKSGRLAGDILSTKLLHSTWDLKILFFRETNRLNFHTDKEN